MRDLSVSTYLSIIPPFLDVGVGPAHGPYTLGCDLTPPACSGGSSSGRRELFGLAPASLMTRPLLWWLL